ncbi:hypothetical protein BCR44DRAFT_1505660 [Catenaria anguillulae PL171]|uniref:Uncharacterized protein n=1 Tax=Catenaria anguillulae PL171 TaxID=765915 RepID=A0A1Y2H4P8_9FUNG|nr:hypothetical protein BCR44DRAFT_1505660 [Catenaria anguillulae PL171]
MTELQAGQAALLATKAALEQRVMDLETQPQGPTSDQVAALQSSRQALQRQLVQEQERHNKALARELALQDRLAHEMQAHVRSMGDIGVQNQARQTQLERERDEAMAAVETLENRLLESNGRLESVTASESQLKSALDAGKERVEALERLINETRQESDGLKRQLEDSTKQIESQKSSDQTLRQQIDAGKQRLQRSSQTSETALRTQLEQSKKQSESLTKLLDDSKKQSESLTKLLEDSKKQIEALKLSETTLRNQLEQSKKRESNLTAFVDKATLVESALKSSIAELNEKIADQSSEMTQLWSQLSAACADADRARADLAAVRNQLVRKEYVGNVMDWNQCPVCQEWVRDGDLGLANHRAGRGH